MAVSTNNKIWRTFTLGCASAPAHHTASQKLKFNVPLNVAFKHDCIPEPMLNLLKYISQEGVTVPDIFRRPGNPSDQRKLMKRLNEGKPVSFAEYNFYTLASVIKKFLLSIPGGIFGAEQEETLLSVLKIDTQLKQYDVIHEVISELAQSTQHFLAILFGVWFRIVNHIEFHSMSSEAMAKSVTGSIFSNSTGNPTLVNKAAKVMEIMIENYAIASMFGADNLQYFADVTCSGIIVTERFTYHYKYPSQQNIQRESSLRSFAQHLRKECTSRGLLIEDGFTEGDEVGGHPSHPAHSNTPSPLLPSQARHSGMTGCQSVPDVNTHNKFKSHLSLPPGYLDRNISRSLSKFDTVKLKQMARLRKRSEWFLNYSKSPQQTRKYTVTSDSDSNEHYHELDNKSEIESVFDDRRSIDTTLIDKPLYEEEISVYGGEPTSTIGSHSLSHSGKTSRQNSDYNKNDPHTETLTKHFVKQTTIIPRTKSTVIQC